MSQSRLAVIALAAAALFHAGQVDAQERWRIRATIDAGVQAPSTTVHESIATPVYLESSAINADYKVATGPLLNGGVTMRLMSHLGAGVAVSWFTKTSDPLISAEMPHPFFYNTPRSIEGTASGLDRRELAAHVQAVYLMASGRVDLALSGGPSFFSVKQGLVTDVSYSESYPFDTATFTTASSATATESGVGFNVGADAGMRLSRHLGVGAQVRFARASLDFTVPGTTATVKSDVGGLQALGGLRIFF